jgi:hypothetical protein
MDRVSSDVFFIFYSLYMRSTPTSALEVVATLHKTRGWQILDWYYVPNFGHSEVLIKITDELLLLLAPRDKFATLIYSVGIFLSISLQKWIGLRNVLIWLNRMDSFSLLMNLFARAELVPAYFLTF